MSIQGFLERFKFEDTGCLKSILKIDRREVPMFCNEFWTKEQRKANPIHEVSYRACFKPQLPAFFIRLLTRPGERVYDPFMGRGTTPVEAALLGRIPVGNDINPLAKVLAEPRVAPPVLDKIRAQLESIDLVESLQADIDLSMFYHPGTEGQLVSLRNYLLQRRQSGQEDMVDKWIRMVATNRLTGHSPGFFSVYTLPPNQAASPRRQQMINQKRGQAPEYKEIKPLILKKSAQLLKKSCPGGAPSYTFYQQDARHTVGIPSESISLTVTSPPFLDIVQYSDDNWLRCWFNGIDHRTVEEEITTPSCPQEWARIMQDVFHELYRITKTKGHVAFEVGEVRNGRVRLEELVIPAGMGAGFDCEAVMINTQQFTKTSSIWGVDSNTKGTNTNRIVIFKKRR